MNKPQAATLAATNATLDAAPADADFFASLIGWGTTGIVGADSARQMLAASSAPWKLRFELAN